MGERTAGVSVGRVGVGVGVACGAESASGGAWLSHGWSRVRVQCFCSIAPTASWRGCNGVAAAEGRWTGCVEAGCGTRVRQAAEWYM